MFEGFDITIVVAMHMNKQSFNFEIWSSPK